jgi:very-short-patch-repair endonuclease
MTLASSFDHRDMDPNRSQARGVELLRLYLQYAASQGKNLGEAGHSGVPLNPFEADIYDTLTAKGIPLLPQWGVSRYRIDLVAQHPQKPGRFVLAIECDGASYHSAPTTRDRDRLRQQQLEALGWRFHRIWSIDWFIRQEEASFGHRNRRMCKRSRVQQRFWRFAIVANGRKQWGHSPCTHNAGMRNGVSQLVHFPNKRN